MYFGQSMTQSFFKRTTKTDEAVLKHRLDLSLRWAKMSDGTFSHVVVYILPYKNTFPTFYISPVPNFQNRTFFSTQAISI